MSLRNGFKLQVFILTQFPITEELIIIVKEIGKEDKQPLMENGDFF